MHRIGRWIGPLIVLALLVAAGILLFRELHHFHWRDLQRSLYEIPAWRIALAALLTVVSYAILTGYDYLALRFAGRQLPFKQVALVSFLGYTSSYNFGALLGGTSIRYRLYSSLGVSPGEILKVGISLAATFWLGAGTIGAVLFLAAPLPIPDSLHLPLQTTRALGAVLLAGVVGYLILTAVWRRPVTIRGWTVQLPSPSLSLLQMAVAIADLCVASLVPYVLLGPALSTSFLHYFAAWLLAIWLSLISHVPGGAGVFELTLLWFLKPTDTDLTLAALLIFRVIYYLIPLLIASCLMLSREWAENRAAIGKAMTQIGRFASIVPTVVALLVFVAGLVLLLSGATPSGPGRMSWLMKIAPLPVVELSHFAGSLVGAALLVLAWGLQRRLDSAYWLTIGLLAFGIVASLVKGLDYEEAVFLSAVLGALLTARQHFYRRGSLFSQPLTPTWLVSIAAAISAALWLAIFAHRHVVYTHELWWTFAFSADAPRSLRATAAAAAVLLLFALTSLIRGGRARPAAPTEAERAAVSAIVARSPLSHANLALLGDKYFLFNDERTALVMYAAQGLSLVAMGDPVGPRQEWDELAWRFRECCDKNDAYPVFYEVSPEALPIYIDLGLSLFKLGEEARVPLADFSLDGPARKQLRQSHHRVERDGGAFEIVAKADIDAVLPELREVSDAWIAEKHAREKGFSLGFFAEEYIRQFDVAIVRQENKIIAFSNIWPGAERAELSVDMIRYRPHSISGLMEALLVHVMLWGKEQGYQWFNLGMAPLAGFEHHPLAPLWNRIGTLVYREGERFYNFQGLRQYKDKFDPVWEPRYLATRGGLALPRVLSDVATLISGGVTGLFGK